MHRLRHRVVVGDRHLDVADRHLVLLLLVYLFYTEKMMRSNFLDVLKILHQKQVAQLRDVQQNPDEQNPDVIPPFLDAVLRFLVILWDVVVVVGLRHQLKMDCCQVVVVVGLRHQLKMDCCQVVELVLLALSSKELQTLVEHHFLLHAELLQFWRLHAWPLLPCLQSPLLAQV
jgi:hypothetical protein